MSKKFRDERELLSKPGDTISETIEYLKMSQAELAERMGKTSSKVNDLITGKEPITMSTALQLEKVLGIDALFWLNREMLYREKLTRLDQEEFLSQCQDWLKTQPIKELKEYGYIKSEKVGPAMVEECLRFYGVAALPQWESLYINQYVSTSFRKSDKHKTTLSSMAAWLRIGEVEMLNFKLNEYNKVLFKENLGEIRKLVRAHPEDFAERLQELCLLAGVALVYTTCIPKAPICGATRWIGGNPLIQLTDRYKSNDHFWFTFFHEAGHIILHGKKEVFIEDFEGYEANTQKETEANEFANKLLLSENIESDFPADTAITEKGIQQIARKYSTHAAIVLGRLQRMGRVAFSFGNSLKVKVVLDNVIKKSKVSK